MGGVTNAILGRIKTTVRRFLTETCTIEAQGAGTGDYGQQVAEWYVVAEDVPCRIIRRAGNATGEEADEVAGRETIVDSYRLIVPAGTALEVGQRVTVGEDVYDVVDLMTALTGEADRQAVITRMRP
jgi:hypothetical protein